MGDSAAISLACDRSDLKVVAFNVSWQLTGELVSKGLSFISSVYLARVLGVEGYGMFTYVWVFITYGMTITSEGLTVYGMREVARDKNQIGHLVANITFLRLCLVTAVYVLTSVLSLAFARSWDIKLLFIYTFLWLFPYALCLDWVFRGMNRMEYAAAWNFVHQAVFMVLLLLFVHGYNDLLTASMLKTVGAVLASVMLWRIVFSRKELLKGSRITGVFEPASLKPLLKTSVRMGGTALMIMVINFLPNTMLMAWDTSKSVGWYSAGYNVISLFMLGSYIIANSFYPRLCRTHVSDRESFFRLLKVMMLIMGSLGLLFSVSTYLLSPYIIPLILGKAYLNSVAPLRALSPVIFLSFIAASLINAFLSSGFERPLFIVTAIGVAVSVLSNALLIARYSMVGAAIATDVSYIIVILAYAALTRNTIFAASQKQRARKLVRKNI